MEGFGDIQSIVAICLKDDYVVYKDVFSYRVNSPIFYFIQTILEMNNVAESLLRYIERQKPKDTLTI